MSSEKEHKCIIVPLFLLFSIYFKCVSRFPSVSKEANIKIIISLDFHHSGFLSNRDPCLNPVSYVLINSLQETIHPRLRRYFTGLISWTAPALAQKVVANPSPPLSIYFQNLQILYFHYSRIFATGGFLRRRFIRSSLIFVGAR